MRSWVSMVHCAHTLADVTPTRKEPVDQVTSCFVESLPSVVLGRELKTGSLFCDDTQSSAPVLVCPLIVIFDHSSEPTSPVNTHPCADVKVLSLSRVLSELVSDLTTR